MSLFCVNLFLHHDHEELITPFIEYAFPNQYACEFPIKRVDQFDMVYHLYIDSADEQKKAISFFEKNIPLAASLYIVDKSSIENTDWQDKWKEHFQPLSIGRHLYLTLPWDKTRTPQNRKRIIIDPGMAFGTGAHPTTRGCLTFIDKFVKNGMTLADIGTGSGILAIAAAKLGATVAANDNDPVATENAASNIRVNRVKSKIRLLTGDLATFPMKQYDILVANLTADLHIQFFEVYQNLSRHFILSGISDYRKNQMDLFLNMLNIKPTTIYEEDGWFSYWIVL